MESLKVVSSMVLSGAKVAIGFADGSSIMVPSDQVPDFVKLGSTLKVTLSSSGEVEKIETGAQPGQAPVRKKEGK